jgi:hypothetical protein
MENSDVTNSEVTQQGTSPEYVELHEASDDDISAFLEGAPNRESAQPQAEPQQQADPVKQETQAEPPQEEPKPQDAVVSKEELEAIRRQLEGQELLLKRRTSEIGELKRQFREFVEQKSQNLDEKFLESPTEALKQARQVEMAQQKLQELEAEEQNLTNVHQAQVLLAHHVGPDGLDAEAIAQSLSDDQMPQEFIQSFLKNPYQAALPETLIQLAKRASAEKKARQMEEALQQLVPYTQKLLEERKQLPQHVLKNVQSALRQAPQVTGSAGGTGQLGGNRAVDPALMSDQELQEFLKGN